MLNKMTVYDRHEPDKTIFTMADLDPTNDTIRKLNTKIEFRKFNHDRDYIEEISPEKS